MKISIVILNWNGGVKDCLESVQSAYEQTYSDKEIIFVDNASNDGSDQAIKENFPDIMHVQTGSNLGCPGGRNYGAQYATGELIFFLENDGAWKTNDVVSEAIDFMEKNPDVGVLYAAVEGYESGVLDAPLDVHGQHQVSLSSSFRGGASIIRTDLFNRLGGFPSDFFRQYEERYLSYLIYEAGYEVVYWPLKRLRHKGSDYNGKSKQVPRFNFRNETRTIIRIMPLILVLKLLPFKFLLNAYRFIKRKDFIWYVKEVYALLNEFSIRGKFITIKCITYKYIHKIRHSVQPIDPETRKKQQIGSNDSI